MNHWPPSPLGIRSHKISALCYCDESLIIEMAPTDQHFLSLIPTAKRSACDRCRKHKVACPPRSSSASDCARCVRLGATCVTGYTKPLGKPTLHHQAMASNEAMETTTTSPPSQGSQPSSSHAFSDHTSVTEPMVEAWPIRDQTEDNNMSSTGWDHWTALPIHSDGLQTWASDTTSVPSLDMVQSWDHAPPFEQNMLDCHNQQPLPPVPEPMRSSNSPGNSPAPSCNITKGLEAAEYNLRLSQLRVNLARQMMQRASGSLDQQQGMTDETEITAEWQRSSLLSHNLGEALCSTSEFLDLVKSYPTLGGVTQSYGDATGLLDLLVSYLHLVAVFGCLFQQMYDTVITDPSVKRSGGTRPCIQPLPNLHLSGFAVSEGKLQTRILLQATQHQFKKIEKVLGIPPEFAVSLHTRDPNNSPRGEQVQALFHCIFNEDQRNNGFMVSASSASTLRTNMAMLGQLLDELES